jgi:hypothetical protein
VADNRASVGYQRGNWQSHRARAEQHAGPDAGPLPFLQLEFHHLLVPLLVLYTVHHHGVPLLEHIQGKSTAMPFDRNCIIIIIIYIHILRTIRT